MAQGEDLRILLALPHLRIVIETDTADLAGLEHDAPTAPGPRTPWDDGAGAGCGGGR